jgi:hypothetical protein
MPIVLFNRKKFFRPILAFFSFLDPRLHNIDREVANSIKSAVSRIRRNIYILDTNARVHDKSRTKEKKINTLSYVHTCH